jgi:hypothetical protein
MAWASYQGLRIERILSISGDAAADLSDVALCV